MDIAPIFREIFDQFSSDNIYRSWHKISQEIRSGDEKERVFRLIVKISMQKLDTYEAGKEVNRENPQISAQFPDFLFKFLHAFQFLPSDQQTFANSMFLLKIIDLFGSECPKIINFSEISYISRLLELATNVLLKDLFENSVNLYPKDGKFRKIGARDLLDGVVMSEEPEDGKYKEKSFLKMKTKLMELEPRGNSDFERKYLDFESKNV
ncbi:RsbRD_N domain-containing protein [Caenorhabditis elegans]|uniref:RsbRD_N domain-containing protein n=1 Tax=Caenorhabditis elegans TaxID=6239 RepID=Q9NEU1_CAEEL|nr:RsbRD_N domain-containing protein [Caenorhabditis elegans]CAC51063.1 RsbRD_N domain-containing protein [Caenorhabditis elegans]|eukprot:NP_741685.1 Uncharacterized protein CELE_Y39B6A.13 [Caenorhabditis elegans]